MTRGNKPAGLVVWWHMQRGAVHALSRVAWVDVCATAVTTLMPHARCNHRQREQQAAAARQHTAAVMQDVKKQETRVKKAMEKAGEEVCRPARVFAAVVVGAEPAPRPVCGPPLPTVWPDQLPPPYARVSKGRGCPRGG